MFSVIIPLYNKEKYIADSIQSVLNQTFTEFELLIVDDNSTDSSVSVVKQFSDSRIRLIHRTERGFGGYAARNEGVRLAKFDYVCFLDADDSYRLDYLLKMRELIERFPFQTIFACGWTEKAGNILKTNAFYQYAERKGIHIIDNYFSHVAKNRPPLWTANFAVKLQVFKKIGMFPENKCKRGGDVETWMRLMLNNQMVWSPYIGAVYNKDVSDSVTKTISDIEIPYVYFSAKQLVTQISDKTKISDIKKYANFYCKMAILHAIVFDINKKEVLKGFFKEEEPLWYFALKFLAIFPSFLLKPLFSIYRKLKLKFDKSDLG